MVSIIDFCMSSEDYISFIKYMNGEYSVFAFENVLFFTSYSFSDNQLRTVEEFKQHLKHNFFVIFTII